MKKQSNLVQTQSATPQTVPLRSHWNKCPLRKPVKTHEIDKTQEN